MQLVKPSVVFVILSLFLISCEPEPLQSDFEPIHFEQDDKKFSTEYSGQEDAPIDDKKDD